MTTSHPRFSEFDSFGPWIYEVTAPEEVPRLYRDYPLDLAATELVLKFPRDIARRNATPQMDLYDHLVVLEQNQLTVLSRRVAGAQRDVPTRSAPGYDAVVIQLADVAAIRDAVNLLDGRLTIATTAGVSLTVRYNGSAGDKVTGLVTALRATMGNAPPTPVAAALQAASHGVATATAVPSLDHDDTYLVSQFLDLRRALPELAVWASHGTRPVTPHRAGLAGAASRLAHALSPMTLHGALVVADSAALELLGRHSGLVRGRSPVYSTSRLVIPLSALDGIAVAPHPTYPEVCVVTIRAGQWSTDVDVPSDSTAARLLDVRPS